MIRKQVGRHRYTVSTKKHTAEEALKELLEFERNPSIYSPDRRPKWKEPVRLDLGDKDRSYLIRQFLAYSRDEVKNCSPWVHVQKVHLEWWKEKLGGKDLRKLSLGKDVLPHFADAKSKAHRVAVLKKLYSWLVATDRIEPGEDPTFRRLSAPKSPPKEVEPFDIALFPQVRLALSEPWRSIWTIQGGTGMHVTEIQRFATGGKIEEPNRGRAEPMHRLQDLPRVP